MKLDPRKAATSEPQTHTTPTPAADETAIATRAYQLWLDRGCPIGSPDVDWYQAEAELRGTSASAA